MPHDDVVITARMIEAGIMPLARYIGDYEEAVNMARKVYDAMERTRMDEESGTPETVITLDDAPRLLRRNPREGE